MRLTYVIMDVNGNTRPQVSADRCYTNRDEKKLANQHPAFVLGTQL